MLTFEQIKDLIELVARNRLAGMELERSGFRLKIDGEQGMASPTSVGVVPLQAPAPVLVTPDPSAPGPAVPADAPPEPPPAAAAPTGNHVLTSPIVGTFYASPNPDAPAFVKIGDRVTKGQVVCIIEAMKLMNEIEADVDGEIVAIHPKNEQPVEFGEPLFGIQT